ncbi:MAG: 2-dehydropantoate 2-reductase family protein [Myxococcales bacterium]|nr:2-dehydropantoate 2-reductase family protein [Myxococcales bacterium]
MKIGILGAGSIGAYVGGRLVAAGVDTVLVGRPALAEVVADKGLRLTDYRGFDTTLPPARIPIATTASALGDCDFVLVTVKGLDTAAAARELAPYVRNDAIVVSFQNGVRNAEVLQAALPSTVVLPGMVPFNVMRRSEAHFHQGTSGRLSVGARAQHHVALLAALERAGLPARAFADMRGVQWGKLLVNLNNSVNALSGLTLLEQLGQRPYRKVMADCVREGLAALRKTDIKPRIDAPIPAAWVPSLMELPDALFRTLARSMIAIDPNARSSMSQDLERGRKTEVDLLNGEIVRLGAHVGIATPINERIVALIRAAETSGTPPSLSARDLSLKLLAKG